MAYDHVEERVETAPDDVAEAVDAESRTVPSAESEREELAREGAYLSRQVFGLEPFPGLVDLYVRANQAVLGRDDAPSPLAAALRRAVRERLDVEALELALRRRRRSNLVTQKVHLLSYLIETQTMGAPLYLNERKNFLRAYSSLAFHTLRGVWKYVHGVRLMRRLGLDV